MADGEALVRAPEDDFESEYVPRQPDRVNLRTLHSCTTRSCITDEVSRRDCML